MGVCCHLVEGLYDRGGEIPGETGWECAATCTRGHVAGVWRGVCCYLVEGAWRELWSVYLIHGKLAGIKKMGLLKQTP